MIVVLFLMSLAAACTSLEESVRELEAIHRAPVTLSAFAAADGRGEFMEYASALEEDDGDWDDVENPVEFCLDAVENIADGDFDSPWVRARAISVLAFTSRKSPSSLVRSSALRALSNLLSKEAAVFSTPEVPEKQPPWTERMDKVRWLRGRIDRDREAAQEKGRTPEERAEYLALIEAFGTLAGVRPLEAWSVLRSVVADLAPGETDPAALEAFAKTGARLETYVFYLVMADALGDRNEIVRYTAIDALFLFPMDTVQPLLELALDRNWFLRTVSVHKYPLQRIQILKHLFRRAESPEDLSLKILLAAAESLDKAESGVAPHAVDLFRKITGLNETEASFWQDWWVEYLSRNADRNRNTDREPGSE